MVRFFTSYNPTESSYYEPPASIRNPEEKIEEPIFPTGKIGESIVEAAGQQNLVTEAVASIRRGASRIELATGLGGPTQPVGAASYGKEARQTLREIARANQVQFTSVHTPVQVGNLSGLSEHGFDDNLRKVHLDEIKKAVTFAADVADGGAVVIHTGEFQRPISEQPWAKAKEGYKFLAYPEEPGRAVFPLVDTRTGEIIGGVRKSQIFRMPVYKKSDAKQSYKDENNKTVRPGDWIDADGNLVDPTRLEDWRRRVPEVDPKSLAVKTQRLYWDDIEKLRQQWRERFGYEGTTEELAFQLQVADQHASAVGSTLFHTKHYAELSKAADELREQRKSFEWAREHTTSTQVRKDMEEKIKKVREQEGKLQHELDYVYQGASGASMQAEAIIERIKNIKPAGTFALDKSAESFAEAGIYALQESARTKNPIFLAPENIFPEGYGSHPEEMINLVAKARDKMVEFITAEKINDPHGRIDPATGRLKLVDNPWRMRMSREEAQKKAEEHIKATLDTEHLGIWRRHFMPEPGETREETDKRFNEWWLDQVKKLADKKIVGHMHFLDSREGAHQHLPAGQGTLPLKEALEYLKSKGYDGTIISEGHSENARFGMGRALTKAWEAVGSPVYRTSFGPVTWGQIGSAYYGQTMPPFYIVGAYSPSNEWKFWTDVPLE